MRTLSVLAGAVMVLSVVPAPVARSDDAKTARQTDEQHTDNPSTPAPE